MRICETVICAPADVGLIGLKRKDIASLERVQRRLMLSRHILERSHVCKDGKEVGEFLVMYTLENSFVILAIVKVLRLCS